MNRSDLFVALVKANPDLSAEEAKLTIETFFERVAEQIGSGGRVEFRGFGTFVTIERSARIGRNPKNGDMVNVPAKRYVQFRASKAIKRRVMDVAPEKVVRLPQAAE